MKRFIVTVIFLASLGQYASAQSTTSAPNRNQAAESKQARAKEEQKAKVQKQKETAKKSADKGKRQTSPEDAAYAAAYKAGAPR